VAAEVLVCCAVEALVLVAGNSVSVCVALPLLPKTRAVAEGESDMTVPETVMIPPGVRVWPSITNVVPSPGSAVKIEVLMVSRGGFVMTGPERRVVVAPLTTR
jgi:hypothetical protein